MTTLQCFAQNIIFKDDFGKSTTRLESQYVPQGGLDNLLTNFKHGTSFYRLADRFSNNISDLPNTHLYNSYNDYYKLNDFNADIWNIDNGFYAVIAPKYIYSMSKITPNGSSISWTGNWWYNSNSATLNHTDNSEDGAVLVVNGGKVLNQYYRRVVQLQPNKSYKLSAYVYAVGQNNVALNFEAQNLLTEEILGSSKLDGINNSQVKITNANRWEEKYWVFKTPNDSRCLNIAIALRNNSAADIGNDFFVDDIQLEEVTNGGNTIKCSIEETKVIDNIVKAYADNVDLSRDESVNLIENDELDGEEGKIILTGTNKNATISLIGDWPKEATLNKDTGLLTFSPDFKIPDVELQYQLCNLINVCSTAYVNFNSTFRTSVCVQDGNFEEAGSKTNVGISTMSKKSENWPQSIPNGFLALESSNKGFVITRTDNVEKILDSREGMIVYDKTDKCVKLFNGAEWKCIERSCNE